MYCSTCGVAVAQSLSYCNYCGAKLGEVTTDSGTSADVKPGLVVSSMVATFVLGLVAIAMLLGMMKVVIRLETGLILGFALLSFLILLGLEGVFLRLLFRGRSTPETGHSVRLKGQPTHELDAEQARMLSEPVASVTENTTRAFEPLYNERRSK